jgi:hypothetical protein
MKANSLRNKISKKIPCFSGRVFFLIAAFAARPGLKR